MVMSRTVAAAAVLLLVVASTAMAASSRKVHQSGSVKGDSGAGVRLVVIKAGGAPKSVKNVKFKNLSSDCSNGKARIRLKLSGAARVDEKRKFETTYKSGKTKVTLEGKVKRDGSRVHGSIKGTTVPISGVGRCEVPSVEFTTRR